MSMLTLNGIVLNVFDTDASTDKKTGELRPASVKVQIQAENTLPNGQKRFDMLTLKIGDGDVYRKLQGKPVRVPVGVFVVNGGIQYYTLKGTAPSAS